MSPEDVRLAILEHALLILLDRVQALEGSQRNTMEKLVNRQTDLPRRMDHVEREIIALRKLPRGGRLGGGQ